MAPSSVFHGHRPSASMNDLASRATYARIESIPEDSDNDSSSSFDLVETSTRMSPPARPASAPLSPPRIGSRSPTRADYDTSASDLSDPELEISLGNSSNSSNNPSRPLDHISNSSRSGSHQSKPSVINVVIPSPIDSDPSQLASQQTPVSAPHPGNAKARFLILMSGSLALFGNYYAYDNPSALNEPLREYMEMDINTYAYFINLLYSVYSIPNVILPWLGGYATDYFGHRRLLVILSIIVSVGHLIVCFGLVSKNAATMYFGRMMFGAAESLSVAQAAITIKYFRGKELAMALGINLCVARLGSVVNDVLTPYIWRRKGVPTAFFVGFVSCVFSTFAVLVSVYLDRKFSAALESNGFQPLATGPGEEGIDTALPGHRSSDVELGQSLSSPTVASSLSAYDPHLPASNPTPGSDQDLYEGIAMQRFHKKKEEEAVAQAIDLEEQSDDGMSSPLDTQGQALPSRRVRKATMARLSWAQWIMLKAREMVDYNQGFWALLGLTTLIVGIIVPFTSIHAGFLQMYWYPGDPEKAAQVMTVPDLLSAILVLPFGLFVDHFGKKTWLFMLSGLLVGFSHLVLGVFHPASPIPALITLGISSGIGSLYTSAIPPLVKEHQLAQAFGMTVAAINLAFTVIPLIVATLMTIDPTVYTYPEIFFSACGFLGFLLSVRLKCLDKDGVIDRKEVGNAPVVVH